MLIPPELPETSVGTPHTIAIGLSFFFGLVIGATIQYLRQRRVRRFTKCLYDELAKVYFCGYTLRDVYSQRFFPRYYEFSNCGFCGQVAAMSMLALKCNPTIRYVYAIAGEERNRHCWVELCHRRQWYIIDPCWSDCVVVPRKRWYRENKPEILEICDYERFWSWPISQQFYEKMLHPESSWLLAELFYIYGFYEDQSKPLFISELAQLQLENEAGKDPNPWFVKQYPEVLFTRRIVHEMMSKPNRLRPPARQIRRARRYYHQVLNS